MRQEDVIGNWVLLSDKKASPDYRRPREMDRADVVADR